MTLLYVAVGGALGSVFRYLVSFWMNQLNLGFPLPVMLINIAGSFAMGAWIGAMAAMGPEKSHNWHMFIAVGMLGGFTTFSTFSLESTMLIEKGLMLQAAAYISGSVILSITALFAGLYLFRSVGA